MPGQGSSYNSWGLAAGLPPLGSLTLNYSVTMPNSLNFPDESDSGTARAGNQVGAHSTQFELGSRSRAHYAEVLAPAHFEDTPYVPPRSGQSLPDSYPAHTSHVNSLTDGHTRTHGIPSYPSPAESHHSTESNWGSSSSSDESQHDLVRQQPYTYQQHPQYQQYPTSSSRHLSHNDPQQQQQQQQHYPTYHDVYRLGLEHVYPAPPSVGDTAMHYRLPAHSPYQSDNVLAPELYHDQLHQDLGTLPTQPSAPSLSSPRGSLQTFSASPAADERSGHLLFEDAGPYLRETLRIPPYQDVNLWALPDPPEGEKPNQPYPILIKLAIYGSPHKQLTLQEIYTTLEDRFQWFRERRNEKAWKNSIRHNLSLNKVFKHAPRAITEPGKGSYWQLDCSSGEGYKRARKRRSKSARAAFDQGDDDFSEGDMEGSSVSAGPSHAGNRPSPAASDDSHIDPELRQGSHVVGEGRTRSGLRRAGATGPYPGPSQQSPRYQSSVLPQESAPRFGQPSFGQASFGRPGFGQTQPRGPASSASSPSAFMSSAPAAFGSVQTIPSRPGDVFATQGRNAPVVQHTPRPGIVIRDEGGLPSARRVQSYPQTHSQSSQESMSSQRSDSTGSYPSDPKGKGRAM